MKRLGNGGRKVNDFDAFARQLESCLWPPERLPGPGPSSVGEELAKAGLLFLSNPTRSMISAAQHVCPELTVEQVRHILRAVAAGILGSKSR
jgi:hypothetical protein